MKLIISFVLSIIVTTAKSQCPNYIGRPYQEGIAMVKNAEKVFGIKFSEARRGNPAVNPCFLNYRADGFYRACININNDSTIRYIQIIAPAVQIDTFVSSQIKPLLLPCADYKSSNWIFWNKQKAVFTRTSVYTTGDPPPLKEFFIEEDEHPIKKATQ